MILSLYQLLGTLGGPLLTRYLNKRRARGKEHPTRFPERLGNASVARPDGKLVWLHGASVGESISLLPLIEAIQEKYADHSVLLTTGTVTSAALMGKRLPDGVIHQFIPVDRLEYVRRFLTHWQPNVAIWAESEIWPNLISETHKTGAKMALINARMSERSLNKWMKLRGFISDILGKFDWCLAQTEEDVARFVQLGAKNVSCYGNLKYASPDLPVDQGDLDHLTRVMSNRALWLAASTHPGEEVMIGRVHQKLKGYFPDLLTVIAPRHPERGGDIKSELAEAGLRVTQRSIGEKVDGHSEIYLCDTMGEMGLFYRLSPIVFMGKSMQPLGGQNPLEPARLNCAVLCGPYMTNFSEIMTSLTEADAIAIVEDEDELVETVSYYVQNPAKCQEMADHAKGVAYAKASVLPHTMMGLAPLFEDKA